MHPQASFFLSCTCLIVLTMTYLYIAPYSKVEESFNMQAMHDMLFHGSDLDKYDHHQFPGVVPRTFCGALLISLIAYPERTLLASMQVPLSVQKVAMSYTCRSILGLFVIAAHILMALALSDTRSRPSLSNIGSLYLLLTACQFHSTFWASRALPNTFAFIISTSAVAVYINYKRNRLGYSFNTVIALFGFAGVVFRSDLILLAIPLFLAELVSGQFTNFKSALKVGTGSVLLSVSCTVLLDSYFWRFGWVWPELQVLIFNTWHNQSHLWGTQPWHAYGSHHLPKMLLLVFPWTLVSVFVSSNYTKNIRLAKQLTHVALGFVVLYSFLPHKESRFIVYALPLLNASAALVMHTGWNTLQRLYRHIIRLAVIFTIAGSLMLSFTMAWISSYNYPGGNALRNLQSEHPEYTALVFDSFPKSIKSKVHVDVYTAQTGASRFLEHPNLIYDKTENLSLAVRQDASRFVARFVEFESWIKEPNKTHVANTVCVTCMAKIDPYGPFRWETSLFSGHKSNSNPPSKEIDGTTAFRVSTVTSLCVPGCKCKGCKLTYLFLSVGWY